MAFRTSVLVSVSVLLSTSAFATGERIAVKGEVADQLRETLCVSMECGEGSDATVSTRVVKGSVEIKVTGADGRVRLEQKVPAYAEGKLSSMDLVSATSAIFKAIESPTAAVESAPKAKEKPAKKSLAKAKKKAPARLMARGAPRSRG